MKDLASYKLVQEEFLELRHACRADPSFPKNWSDWEDLLETAFAQATAAGLAPPPLFLDVEQFVSWCSGLGIVPCLDAMRAYAIIKRTPRCP